MTYIEFFDKTVIENICACLTAVPRRVILIGDKRRLLTEHAQRYAALFESRGKQVEFICRLVNKNDVRSIVAVLTEIVQNEEQCAIDLTGGEELYLLATGIVFERFPEYHLQMHRFNIRNNTIVDVDQDGKTIFEGHLPMLSVEENIRIYGGDVIYDSTDRLGTHLYGSSPELFSEIDRIWHIAAEYQTKWNLLTMMVLYAGQAAGPGGDPLTVEVSMDRLNRVLAQNGLKYFHAPYILRALQAEHQVREYDVGSERFFVQFRDPLVRQCLEKAGLILELKIYAAAVRAKDTDGEPVYNDVQTGVLINWKGDGNITPAETRNEVDVMMMKGMVPVFVSCKHGFVEREELYKFSTVAERFGGKYARKILVAPALSLSTSPEYIEQRAAEMGIQIVEDVWTLDEEALERRVRSFWNQNLR